MNESLPTASTSKSTAHEIARQIGRFLRDAIPGMNSHDRLELLSSICDGMADDKDLRSWIPTLVSDYEHPSGAEIPAETFVYQSNERTSIWLALSPPCDIANNQAPSEASPDVKIEKRRNGVYFFFNIGGNTIARLIWQEDGSISFEDHQNS